ncbi:hypothetical protein BOX15_Mlig006056g1 [Macrostomum lignano]|uniref:WSC domain-containing protein n=1 Tax=Macrostomum lignano TaxID=282301 RepID=A0A267DGV9_9PLAT|nr:hypothetical protein BOX15_Mlig006056g1 [Macrostomum lignano]
MGSSSGAPEGLSSPVKRFCGYTTAHGLGRFSEQSNLIGRVIWVSFLLATYSGFAYHLSTLFERFLQAPVLTKMTVSTLQFEFPDVYICPTNAVTMSRIFKKLPQNEVTFGEFFLKKSVEEKIGIYSFDLSSGRYDLELNDMTKALLSVLHSMEEIIMSYFQFFDIADAAKCRRTPSGEEYSGNVSSAVVYGFTTMTVTSINTSAFTPSPYRGVKQCMRWNDAAQKLLSLGESGLANRLLALNFSDSESRCRSPPGLPLSEFFPIASRSVFRHAGCLPLALTNSSSFNFTCYRGGLSSLETCAECCGRRSFQYMAISRQDCFCGSSIGGYENSSSVCNASCLHDNSAICGSETAVTVLQIRDNGSRPLHVANFSDLDAISSGPYCFFADELSDKLNAAFCEIPYCQISRTYDCIVSSEDKLTQQQRLSRYTGRRNVTSTGRRCMPWSQLSTIEQVLKARRGSEVGFMDEVREMLIQTPDRLEGESDNYCRPVSVVVDSVNIHGPKDFQRFSAIDSEVPVCIPEDFWANIPSITIKFGYLFNMIFQTCNVPLCYTEVPSVTATIRDSVGEHLLARQFGSDLNAGLTECSFAGQKCTKDDFLNVAHPQLGMCHKFLKQRFTANMTSTQLAESQLSIKYFTDSTDSKGQTVSNIDKLTRVVRDSRGSDATQVAFKAVIVPDSSFPWASNGVNVATAQRMDVHLRFDKYSRLSTSSRPCLETTEPITYRLPSWKLFTSNEDSGVNSDAQEIMRSSNWTLKLSMLRNALLKLNGSSALTVSGSQFKVSDRENCVNTYVVEKFTNTCRCLPGMLPIQEERFKKLSYCFDMYSRGNISANTEKCYIEQLSKITQYHFEAMNECKSPCSKTDFSTRYITYPWPNLLSVQSLDFLKKLASDFGYRHDISLMRGASSIYYLYLKAQNLSDTPVINRSTEAIQSFESELAALQNRLAQLTVQAWQSRGHEVSEEEAYPAKNLVADIGGALGLWSGISILTICELLELFIYLGQALAARVQAQSRMQSKNADGQPEESARPESEMVALDTDAIQVQQRVASS